VLHGVVNRPRIDGEDGVAGSIPAAFKELPSGRPLSDLE
jgi:hypothetical protein